MTDLSIKSGKKLYRIPQRWIVRWLALQALEGASGLGQGDFEWTRNTPYEFARWYQLNVNVDNRSRDRLPYSPLRSIIVEMGGINASFASYLYVDSQDVPFWERELIYRHVGAVIRRDSERYPYQVPLKRKRVRNTDLEMMEWRRGHGIHYNLDISHDPIYGLIDGHSPNTRDVSSFQYDVMLRYQLIRMDKLNVLTGIIHSAYLRSLDYKLRPSDPQEIPWHLIFWDDVEKLVPEGGNAFRGEADVVRMRVKHGIHDYEYGRPYARDPIVAILSGSTLGDTPIHYLNQNTNVAAFRRNNKFIISVPEFHLLLPILSRTIEHDRDAWGTMSISKRIGILPTRDDIRGFTLDPKVRIGLVSALGMLTQAASGLLDWGELNESPRDSFLRIVKYLGNDYLIAVMSMTVSQYEDIIHEDDPFSDEESSSSEESRRSEEDSTSSDDRSVSSEESSFDNEHRIERQRLAVRLSMYNRILASVIDEDGPLDFQSWPQIN